MASSNELFGKLDNEYSKIGSYIKDKGIEIKTIKDIERIEIPVSKSIKASIDLISKSSYDDYIKNEMKKAVLIETVRRLSEEFEMDPMALVMELDRDTQNLFKKAIKP